MHEAERSNYIDLLYMVVPMVTLSLMVTKTSFAPPSRKLGQEALIYFTYNFSGLNAETPQVSYVKAIDVWMGACTAFIFSALLEFTVVNYLSRRRGCGGNPVNTSYHMRNGHHQCSQVHYILKCN